MKRVLGCLAVGLLTLAASAQFSNPANDVPAYHAGPPTQAMPPLLHGAQLTGPSFANAYQVAVYKMAARVQAVLYQEPCYCHCDRSMGHQSLHSCFEGTHGAACETCMKEAVYTYRQTMARQSPAQIRAGIERGEFMKMELETLKVPAGR